MQHDREQSAAACRSTAGSPRLNNSGTLHCVVIMIRVRYAWRRHMNMDILAADVIGDVAIVLGVSSVLGAVARRCGQPTVVGQILAGILLGPTLLGRLPGHLTTRLFTHAAIPYISVIAQLAVVIFMFTVGYEINFKPLRGHGRAAPLVAAGALLIPLALGSGIAVAGRGTFAAMGEPHTGTRSFVLFMGVAISVTALPVLASVVRERGLAG